MILEKVIDAGVRLAEKYLSGQLDKINSDEDLLSNTNLDDRIVRKARSILDLNPVDIRLNVSTPKTLERLNAHNAFLTEWSDSIQIKEFGETIRVSSVYIALDAHLTPTRARIEPNIELPRKPLEQILDDEPRNILILGLPGAGKTTTMKKVVNSLITGRKSFENGASYPILVRFRDVETDIRPDEVLYSEISKHVHVTYEDSTSNDLPKDAKKELEQVLRTEKKRAFYKLIESTEPLIVLDGFDELPNQTMKKGALSEIEFIGQQFPGIRLVLTCRTGEIKNNVYSFSEYEVAPLSEPQINDFTSKWLPNPEKRLDFLDRLHKSPFNDTAIKPLTLAFLCMLYSSTGEISERPKTIYRKIVRLLLEEWNEQRKTPRRSRYANFDVDEKFDFLCELAHWMSVEARRYTIDRNDLISAYQKISRRFRLPTSEAELVVDELESHTGLYLKVGFDSFEFAHKSLHEYLAAELIVRLPYPPTRKDEIENLAAEIAVAVSISSRPSEYLSDVIKRCFIPNKLGSEYFYALTTRLDAEKPSFENDNTGMANALFLVSLWYTNGSVPKTRKMTNNMDTAELSIPIDDQEGGVPVLEWPIFHHLFSVEEWSKFLEEVLQRSDVKCRHGVVSIIPPAKSDISLAYRNHLVLPKQYFENFGAIIPREAFE
ncbi:NACHT domain-containing protein [uncultured Pelagimonas sp.]|uniref:NACHT domain-containing protein n=1 Tax=uncultured Pelagimonas sp. TaxID=1618102 RepID=UPI002611B334|nr:NACHT domain-containing protein [uncultured Pelagimonas sp.]